MAIFADALREHLVELGLVEDRVSPNRPLQNQAYPQVSFFRPSTDQRPLPAISGGAPDWEQALYQIDVWSKSYGEAWRMADALRRALKGHRGIWSGWRVAVVSWSARDQYHDDLQPPAVHQVICEITVQFGDYQA